VQQQTVRIRRPHIDEILGDSATRYFGAGFRQVRHRLYDVRVDVRNRSANLVVEVQYPSAWSKKRNRELQPHLSTIDAMTVAADLAELYLRQAYGLSAADAARCWIRRSVMKASATPTTDLAHVSASTTLERTEASADAICGHFSQLKCVIGSMNVELVVDHPIVEATNHSASYAQIDDALGPAACRHYAEGHKGTFIDLSDIVADAPDRAAATMILQPSPAPGAPDGLSASYEPFVSMMHALVAAAQMSQVVLYQFDQITRETSNNMWLRRLAMEMHRPTTIDRPLLIQTWITKTNVLPMKASQWRSANFVTSFPGIQMDYNLAHELTSTTSASTSAPATTERTP